MTRMLLLIAAVLCALSTAFATVLENTGFPWEGCKQVTSTASYNLTLKSYKERPDKTGSEICYNLYATDLNKCNAAMALQKKKTRCCTAKFNKIKFWPAQQCYRAHKSISFLPRGSSTPFTKSWSTQTMKAPTVAAYTLPGDTTPPGDQWVVKSTALDLTREQADGMTICVTLGAPCPTLSSFAYGGKVLEWLLYDAKVDNYECCVPGITPVLTQDYIA